MLLLSKRAMSCGLGNQYDLVGRFFMEHLYLNSGELQLNNPPQYAPFYSVHTAIRSQSSTRIEAMLSVADDAAYRSQILRNAMHFPARWLTRPAYDSDAVQALAHLFREARMGWIPYNWAARVGRVVRGARQVSESVYGRVAEPLRPRRSLRSLAVRSISEQAPNPASRLLLSDRRDRLGRQLVRLDWQLTELDLRTISTAHQIVAAGVERAGVGELHTIFDSDSQWQKRITGGRHHMGTTRMSTNEHDGVVDADCRVHGVDNLFVAGSSVFPTGGYANPTLTIVALALRLADHIKSRLT
jgi:choline dehydrogenase-like flavoprotein